MRTIEGQAIIDAAKKAIGDTSIEIEEELLEGPVADAIISSASIRKVDLIVMGSRGMGSLKGLVFGSVSNKVSQYAPCAVLVVR
jgi:nucleotide-binding universal stress UspA family protein